MTEKFKSCLDIPTTGSDMGSDVDETKEKGLLRVLLSILDEKSIGNIMKPENFLGEGCSKQVYQIPNLPDIVLYVIKKEFIQGQPIMPFEKVNDFIEGLNYGQTLATSPSGVGIMTRVYGNSHGVDVRINKMRNFDSGKSLEITDAINFYNQVKAVAGYPINAYKHLASQLKILNQRKIRIDSINPNNVIINNINNTFCIIDFDDINRKHDFSVLPDPINGAYDMRTLLSDGMLNLERLRILPENLRDNFIKYTTIILEKCKLAASLVGLNTNYDCTIEFFKMAQEGHAEQSFTPLDKFNNFLKYYTS